MAGRQQHAIINQLWCQYDPTSRRPSVLVEAPRAKWSAYAKRLQVCWRRGRGLHSCTDGPVGVGPSAAQPFSVVSAPPPRAGKGQLWADARHKMRPSPPHPGLSHSSTTSRRRNALLLLHALSVGCWPQRLLSQKILETVQERTQDLRGAHRIVMHCSEEKRDASD